MNQKKSFFFALVAMLTTAVFVWYAQRPIAPQQATWEDVMAEAEAGGYRIIKTEALAERYREDPSDMMLIDTRQGWEYRTGTIAGALHFSMEPTWWSRWRKAKELNQFLGKDKERMIVFF